MGLSYVLPGVPHIRTNLLYPVPNEVWRKESYEAILSFQCGKQRKFSIKKIFSFLDWLNKGFESSGMCEKNSLNKSNFFAWKAPMFRKYCLRQVNLCWCSYSVWRLLLNFHSTRTGFFGNTFKSALWSRQPLNRYDIEGNLKGVWAGNVDFNYKFVYWSV